MDTQKRSRRVLIVDDDAALRDSVAQRMRRLGFVVVTAERAEAALVHYDTADLPFDVVITDVHMPGMSGVELTRILLQRRPSQRIVIMTGEPDQAPLREAISWGAVSCLPKPFEMSELEAFIHKALLTDYQAEP